ncbi:hypothetical protein AB672_07155 [Xylella taiwanensis]|nr:hypothetical protein AB672_07155 [Xylella taiwanensis]
MLPECGHCLDVSRDTPTVSQDDVGVQSVAPVDASGVKDLEGLLKTEDRLTTPLWREAIADIMVVGFWTLAVPGAAHDLVTNLRQNRVDNKAGHDTLHRCAGLIVLIGERPSFTAGGRSAEKPSPVQAGHGSPVAPDPAVGQKFHHHLSISCEIVVATT